MIAIYQVKASPAGTAIEMWEWKGTDLPFENEGDGDTIRETDSEIERDRERYDNNANCNGYNSSHDTTIVTPTIDGSTTTKHR
jgi:hypothetical protein